MGFWKKRAERKAGKAALNEVERLAAHAKGVEKCKKVREVYAERLCPFTREHCMHFECALWKECVLVTLNLTGEYVGIVLVGCALRGEGND